MASFGHVLDLLDDSYLNLQDVVGNVEPFPLVVPYDDYTETALVYRMDTNHELFLGLIQEFTSRRAQELDSELWTWLVQWEIEAAATSGHKRPRIDTGARAAPPKKKRPITIFERRRLAADLMQEEEMLRILIDIVQVRSELVPNFVEFLYKWVDFFEGDGKALQAALKSEIPSLWDFDFHPLELPDKQRRAIEKTKHGMSIDSERKADDEAGKDNQEPEPERQKPDLTALERLTDESERLQYREVKYGIKPHQSRDPIPPLINLPRDPKERTKYYAACYRSRERALYLLQEAGLSIHHITNYKKMQDAHPRDTPITDYKGMQSNAMRYHELEKVSAEEVALKKAKCMALREKQHEINISRRLATETRFAAANNTSETGACARGSSPLIPSTQNGLRKHDTVDKLLNKMNAMKKRREDLIHFVPGPLEGIMKSERLKDAQNYATLLYNSMNQVWNESDSSGDDLDDIDPDEREDNNDDNDFDANRRRDDDNIDQGRMEEDDSDGDDDDNDNHRSAPLVSQHSQASLDTLSEADIAEYISRLNTAQIRQLLPLLTTAARQAIIMGEHQNSQIRVPQLPDSTPSGPTSQPPNQSAGFNVAGSSGYIVHPPMTSMGSFNPPTNAATSTHVQPPFPSHSASLSPWTTQTGQSTAAQTAAYVSHTGSQTPYLNNLQNNVHQNSIQINNNNSSLDRRSESMPNMPPTTQYPAIPGQQGNDTFAQTPQYSDPYSTQASHNPVYNMANGAQGRGAPSTAFTTTSTTASSSFTSSNMPGSYGSAPRQFIRLDPSQSFEQIAALRAERRSGQVNDTAVGTSTQTTPSPYDQQLQQRLSPLGQQTPGPLNSAVDSFVQQPPQLRSSLSQPQLQGPNVNLDSSMQASGQAHEVMRSNLQPATPQLRTALSQPQLQMSGPSFNTVSGQIGGAPGQMMSSPPLQTTPFQPQHHGTVFSAPMTTYHQPGTYPAVPSHGQASTAQRSTPQLLASFARFQQQQQEQQANRQQPPALQRLHLGPSNLTIPPSPSSPMTSLPANFNAVSPFLNANFPANTLPEPVPIHIYLPKILVPFTKHQVSQPKTDALLLGYSIPGSGRIVLSKAIFLSIGVWENTLRRVRHGKWTVLEAWKRMGTTAAEKRELEKRAEERKEKLTTPHEIIHVILSQAHGFMTSSERENSHTKRWRATPGPMPLCHLNRGAVWEGYGLCIDTPLEICKEDREVMGGDSHLGRAWNDKGVIVHERLAPEEETDEDRERKRRRAEINAMLEEEEEEEGEEEEDDDDDDDEDEEEEEGEDDVRGYPEAIQA